MIFPVFQDLRIHGPQIIIEIRMLKSRFSSIHRISTVVCGRLAATRSGDAY